MAGQYAPHNAGIDIVDEHGVTGLEKMIAHGCANITHPNKPKLHSNPLWRGEYGMRHDLVAS